MSDMSSRSTFNVEDVELAQNSDPAGDPALPVVAEEQSISADAALNEALTTEIEQLRGERDELLNRLARAQAEFDNARKRAEKERADFRDYATANVVEQFLPVVDNFNLALNSTGTVEQLRGGVELIVKQMDEVLRQLNVNPVPAVGAQFDPRVHEALGKIEKNDVPDEQVLEEVRRGYTIRDRLIRPALVRVAVNTEQRKA